MGNQGQNMFTILLSPMEFLFLKKSVRMIYFLVTKQLNMSENFKIGFMYMPRRNKHALQFIVNSKQKINEEKTVTMFEMF